MSQLPIPNLLGNTQVNEQIVTPLTENVTILPVITTVSQINDPMLLTVKDITFNLILHLPGLRSKLDEILNQPNMAIEQISQVYKEIETKIPESEMNKLRTYVSNEKSRTSLLGILQTSFQDIMSDGKVDMNDANHFLTLIYNIVTLFNESAQDTNMNISITGDAVMFFLYFIIKCILILCLDGEEETLAIGLLDSSFKLISIAVLPITKMKCSCNPFSLFKK
jgi:hypothetical protein